MAVGYFDNKHKEYVITTPKTPVKWINYIGGLDFGGFIDQTGGALLCKGDPALNRITKYIPQSPASDFNATSLYIRIKKEDGYSVFSPFYSPSLSPYAEYECRVGLGYNRYTIVMEQLKIEILVFVPLEGGREIRDIQITNLSADSLEIDVIPIVEYSHFEAIKQFNNADWVPQTMQSEIVTDDENIKIIKQYAYMKKGVNENFFTANMDCDSFETDREKFLGDNGYGSFKNPLSLHKESLSNYVALRGNNICAPLYKMGLLKPEDSVRLITQLGQMEPTLESFKQIQNYRSIETVNNAFEELKKKWNGYTQQFVVETPDENLNTLVNIYNPRQCMITKNWSRFLSLYQLGLGSRGIGFRDSSQDVLGAMGIAPKETTDLMLKLLSTQKRDGSAMHQFFPSTMEATNGDSAEMEDRYDYYGDDHLWIILSVCQYVKETGDMEFLETKVGYYEKDKSGKAIECETVLQHLLRSLAFTKANIGQHGIPLLGFADWNDTVNLPKGSESIFNANLYGKTLKEMIQLTKVLGMADMSLSLEEDYLHMKNKVNETCWDGQWFVRYFDQHGNPLGSKDNSEGKIYTNAQSWSVISGFADNERGNLALDSVKNLLATEYGIKLSYPGYNGFDPEKGGVSTYPPGAKENGGIFLHSNPWVIIAETLLGHGNQAYDYYQAINPIGKNETIDTFEVEPYVFPQNILGNEHPQFGLARNSWLSGTASWMYVAACQYILGVRGDYEGLIVDPCIPKEWSEFKVTKQLKGDTYKIHVTNPNHVEKGIQSIDVDGIRINTTFIPYQNDGKEHIIHVIMG